LLTALQQRFASKQNDSSLARLKLSGQESGVNVYATPENRPATASDRLALARASSAGAIAAIQQFFETEYDCDAFGPAGATRVQRHIFVRLPCPGRPLADSTALQLNWP
jgi:hypothetical protein